MHITKQPERSVRTSLLYKGNWALSCFSPLASAALFWRERCRDRTAACGTFSFLEAREKENLRKKLGEKIGARTGCRRRTIEAVILRYPCDALLMIYQRTPHRLFSQLRQPHWQPPTPSPLFSFLPGSPLPITKPPPSPIALRVEPTDVRPRQIKRKHEGWRSRTARRKVEPTVHKHSERWTLGPQWGTSGAPRMVPWER